MERLGYRVKAPSARAIGAVTVFVAFALLAASAEAVRPRLEGGNEYYRVTINDTGNPSYDAVAGYYGAWTSSEHPVTELFFEDGRMLSWHPAENRAADHTHAGLRSYTSGTDYLLGRHVFFEFEPSPGFECVEASALNLPVVEEVFVGGEARGVRATWAIVNSGDDIDVELLLLVHGEDMMDGAVEVSLTIRNRADAALALGARHAWAVRSLGGLPRYFGSREPGQPPEPLGDSEASWAEPTARAWEAWSSTDQPYSAPWDATYAVAGAISGPESLDPRPTPPDLLLWTEMDTSGQPSVPGLADLCFAGEIMDPARLARGQMAAAPYWGHDEEHAIVLDPGGEVTLTQYLMAFRFYPLQVLSDGPWEQPCEGAVTAVPISVLPAPRYATGAEIHSEWTSTDPRVSFEDPASPETIAFVEGAGTFPIHYRTWVGPWEAHVDEQIVVVDTEPPRFETLTASPASLWPPNHRMEDVTIDWEVADDCDPAPGVRLVSVESNEPQRRLRALGAGSTEQDVAGADLGEPDHELQLRAERAGTRLGRVYTLTYEAEDAAGNLTRETVEVSVEHDRGPRSRRPRR